MKNIHPLSWLALACMFAGLVVALVPWCLVATQSYEAYQASFWCQATRIIGLALMFAPVMAVIGYVVIDFCLSLSAMFRRMNRWTWRKWGAIPAIIGVLALLGLPGPDDAPNSLLVAASVVAVGIGLMVLGWLINHWPPSSYWSYIFGRAVVPPRQHIPYTPNMGVYGE